MEIHLMPGMHGTGHLFAALASRLAEHAVVTRAYPSDRRMGYDALFAETVVSEPVVLVAESFSGPLAIRLAAAYPEHVRGLVLVGSFARGPGRGLRALPGALLRLLVSLLARIPPPAFVLRWALLGRDASDQHVAALRSAIDGVKPGVLADRLVEIGAVDARPDLARVTAPVMYVGGTRDRLVGRAVVAELREVQPEMQVHWLDAPHIIAHRRPDELARLLTSFVAEPR